MSAWNLECMEYDVYLIKKRELEVYELAKRAADGHAAAVLEVEKGLTEINTMSRRFTQRYYRDKEGRINVTTHLRN